MRQLQEPNNANLIFDNVINPKQEVLCYEALWSNINGISLSNMEKLLDRKRLPSELLQYIPKDIVNSVINFLDNLQTYQFNVLFRGTVEYPCSLMDIEIPLLYFKGDLSLIESRCVSVVGARKASQRGLDAAARISKTLTAEGFTVVSGLASGIDTAAHIAAIDAGGYTIGVIGTPITHFYPKENINLQQKIAKDYLLLSHVPFFKYSKQNNNLNRFFFPERNKIMAALSKATIIAEASDTSGSHHQAKECLRLGRQLIILKHVYDNKALKWPENYVSNGALVAQTPNEIIKILHNGK
ncbi:MAG: DNA-protecting protein DprA [Deltaproteobacteria bacterium]|jgi:DNA processing protein|nr:DNA-protecting protein DprA [Deltaproteobacteria bacterium]